MKRQVIEIRYRRVGWFNGYWEARLNIKNGTISFYGWCVGNTPQEAANAILKNLVDQEHLPYNPDVNKKWDSALRQYF